jgi:hypothetical protein
MPKFYASRLTKGNELFPAIISINKSGLHLKLPSYIGGQERSIPYRQISSVEIICPIIGYSTIIIQTTGQESLEVHGFLARQVRKMRELILTAV